MSLVKGNQSSAVYSFQSNSLSWKLAHSFGGLSKVSTICSIAEKLDGIQNQLPRPFRRGKKMGKETNMGMEIDSNVELTVD